MRHTYCTFSQYLYLQERYSLFPKCLPNQSLTDIGECVILGQTSSTSESNQIELPDDINNYKLLILMYLSTDGNILNTNIVPIKYFKQTKYRVVAIWTNTSLGAFAKYIDDTHINLYVRTQYSAVLIGVK